MNSKYSSAPGSPPRPPPCRRRRGRRSRPQGGAPTMTRIGRLRWQHISQTKRILQSRTLLLPPCRRSACMTSKRKLRLLERGRKPQFFKKTNRSGKTKTVEPPRILVVYSGEANHTKRGYAVRRALPTIECVGAREKKGMSPRSSNKQCHRDQITSNVTAIKQQAMSPRSNNKQCHHDQRTSNVTTIKQQAISPRSNNKQQCHRDQTTSNVTTIK